MSGCALPALLSANRSMAAWGRTASAWSHRLARAAFPSACCVKLLGGAGLSRQAVAPFQRGHEDMRALACARSRTARALTQRPHEQAQQSSPAFEGEARRAAGRPKHSGLCGR